MWPEYCKRAGILFLFGIQEFWWRYLICSRNKNFQALLNFWYFSKDILRLSFQEQIKLILVFYFSGPASGELVHVTSSVKPNDHTGCQMPFESSRPDRLLPPPGTWIALIKRGGCNFEIKVENAFRSNATGVLVYNDRDSASLDKMKLSSEPRRK